MKSSRAKISSLLKPDPRAILVLDMIVRREDVPQCTELQILVSWKTRHNNIKILVCFLRRLSTWFLCIDTQICSNPFCVFSVLCIFYTNMCICVFRIAPVGKLLSNIRILQSDLWYIFGTKCWIVTANNRLKKILIGTNLQLSLDWSEESK